MANLPALSADNLNFNDAPQLIWIRVQDALGLLWSENPKLHDWGGTIESILRHGFQELPKYDSTLQAIKAGNGRVEVLASMEKDKQIRNRLAQDKMQCPRGLAVTLAGEWAMPLLIGTDAPSRALAESYAIDSNNLTMAGGDFTAIDMAKMWSSAGYQKVLEGLADSNELPVSVDMEAFQGLMNFFTQEAIDPNEVRGSLLDKFSEYGVKPTPPALPDHVYRIDGRHILIVCDFIRQWDKFISYLTGNAKFIPLPGVYILVTQLAKDYPLVMVQPDEDLAGMILASADLVYGVGSIEIL